ncbi:hypothetical protein BH20ACT20_BH20ACT20_08220 [soil metagenome]
MLLACSSGRSLLDSFLALTWILNLRVPLGFFTLSEVNVALERRLIRGSPAGAVGERSVDLAPLVLVLQVAALVEMVLAARQRDLDLGP